MDYGSKTVGVAVCDPLGLTAQTVETIVRKEEDKLRRTFRRIEDLAREYEITSIVLGYPKNMDHQFREDLIEVIHLAVIFHKLIDSFFLLCL